MGLFSHSERGYSPAQKGFILQLRKGLFSHSKGGYSPIQKGFINPLRMGLFCSQILKVRMGLPWPTLRLHLVKQLSDHLLGNKPGPENRNHNMNK